MRALLPPYNSPSLLPTTVVRAKASGTLSLPGGGQGLLYATMAYTCDLGRSRPFLFSAKLRALYLFVQENSVQLISVLINSVGDRRSTRVYELENYL